MGAEPLAPTWSGRQFEAPIDRDRMVQGDQRGQDPVDGQDAVAEALVVMDDVELRGSRSKGLVGSKAEGERFGEGPEGELGDLDQVGDGFDLPIGREPAGVVVVEDVETGQLVQPDPLVEHRVRLAAEHLDVVTEIGQRLGQMSGVDPLATNGWLRSVGQVRQPKRTLVGHRIGWR